MEMLGKDRIRLLEPARATDLLIYYTVGIDTKPSQSKPDRGVIVLAATLSRDFGAVIMTQEVTSMASRSLKKHYKVGNRA